MMSAMSLAFFLRLVQRRRIRDPLDCLAHTGRYQRARWAGLTSPASIAAAA